MTIPAGQTSTTRHVGNGTASVFDFEFKITDPADLLVTITDGNNVATVKALTTDYTVAGAGNEEGGSITLVAGALTTGHIITIEDNVQASQLTPYGNQSAFHANLHESSFDKLTRLVKRLLDSASRSMRLPSSVAGVSALLPVPAALNLLRWNASATEVENVAVSDISQTLAASNWVVDRFEDGVDYTAGTTTTLTLSQSPGVIQNTWVFFDGVIVHQDDYTIDGNVITFDSAIPVSTNEVEVRLNQVLSQATAAADAVLYTPSFSGAVTVPVSTVLTAAMLTVYSFGAVGGGADDSAALQAALDANRPVILPPGQWRTTTTLIADPARNRNCGFFGNVTPSLYPDTTQTGGPTWDGDDECVILYDGAGGAGTAVISVSPEPVGIEPSSTFENTVYGFWLVGVTLDGGDKADHGFYSARLQQPHVENCIARRCKKDGWYINGTYSGYFGNITAYLNGGRGISVGAAGPDLGWTVNNKCNGVRFVGVWGYANGGDKDFDESTDPTKGCGVYFRPHRGCSMTGVTAELNDGVGFIFEPTSYGNTVRDIYTELNSDYEVGGTDAIDDGRASKSYAIAYSGVAGAVGYGNVVEHGALNGEELWLFGTEPSTGRPESAPEFRNLNGGSGITAAWGNYKLVNCGEEFHANITGSAPTAGYHLPAGVLFDRSGVSLDVYDPTNLTLTLEGSSVAGTGWTYSVNVGSHTRIGRVVHFTGRVAVTAIGSGAAGSLILKGLGVNVNAANNHQNAMALSNVSGMTTAIVAMDAQATLNSDEIAFYHRTGAAVNATQTQISDISNGFSFNISGFYHV